VICNEKINVLIPEIKNFFREVDCFDPKKRSGTFKYAVLRATSMDSSVSFVLNEDSSRIAGAVDKIKAFAQVTTADNVVVTYVPSRSDESTSNEFFAVKGTGILREKYMGMEFVFSVQGFFQNNHEMAEKMHEYSRRILESHDTKDAHLLDLYGGVGTLGIVNADLFNGVTIVENNEPSIEAAQINIEKNNVKNAEAVLLDAKNLKKIDLPNNLFVITDPPRTGMDPKTIEELNKLKPKVILYVSCNVSQLAREIQKLRNYSVKSAALFDFFPQTNHSESVVELVRK
jgi:tRNA/tmRNA/rRNA uracil-C5-methylase (TrmA/RlmC/RlmD family)